MEIGLLTAIAIRGRPVKGLSLADHVTGCGSGSRYPCPAARLPRTRRNVLIDVGERSHSDQCARYAGQRTYERERSLRVVAKRV